jgi:hypothetical protein
LVFILPTVFLVYAEGPVVDACFVGACSACARKRAHSLFVAYYRAKPLLGRSRRRWEDKIKKFGEEIEWEAVDWISLAHESDQ